MLPLLQLAPADGPTPQGEQGVTLAQSRCKTTVLTTTVYSAGFYKAMIDHAMDGIWEKIGGGGRTF